MKARVWFEARGRSARSRGLSWAQAKQEIRLYSLPAWARRAFARGHLLQAIHPRPALGAVIVAGDQLALAMSRGAAAGAELAQVLADGVEACAPSGCLRPCGGPDCVTTCRRAGGVQAPAPVEPKPALIEINYELGGRWWHMNCHDKDGKYMPSGIMREVERDKEAKRSLIRCMRCGEQGYYQFGWVGLARVPMELSTDGVALATDLDRTKGCRHGIAGYCTRCNAAGVKGNA